ncbi:hypothetical protein TNCV_4723641 [Trichonephila clavipes]|uniref:Uncharacterized protein n=1 Tax=Trichonephila clavipes TaxID=2585209 RepID=A0A8X7BEW6_TRICX|nr:hypothetical protein TNCV_4723641 [Trichonephila clavipes]
MCNCKSFPLSKGYGKYFFPMLSRLEDKLESTKSPICSLTRWAVDKKSRFCCKGGAGGRRQRRVELFRSCYRVELFSPAELSCSVRAAESSCFSSCNGFGFRVELFSPTAKLSCF